MACYLIESSHYLNRCWLIVNWTLGNKCSCNLNENTTMMLGYFKDHASKKYPGLIRYVSLMAISGATMMTSSNISILRVTGHLCKEFIGHQWIPFTKAGDAELWCFLWSTNNGDAGNWRRHRADYNVTVMVIKARHYWPFANVIHWRPLDSSHIGPVIPKTFPWLDVIMVNPRYRRLFYRPTTPLPTSISTSHPSNKLLMSW